MPLRSSGCFTCRKRKIRCDETRPGCKKCATHGVKCPGYRTEVPGGVEFRDQTGLTVKRARGDYGRGKDGASRVRLERERSESSEVVELDRDEVNDNPTAEERQLALSYSTGTLPSVPFVGEELLQQVLAWPASSIPQPPEFSFPLPFNSPAANRTALYSTFLDLYMPKDDLNTRLDHFSLYETISYSLASTGGGTDPALHQALDSLSLITIGGQYNDRSLVELSLRAYGRALGHLSKTIASASKPHQNASDGVVSDSLLATVTVLGACALFEAIGTAEGGWGQHVKGSQQLLLARGPESITSPLSLLLLSNTRHGSLIWALIERKAPVMARPEWRCLIAPGGGIGRGLAQQDRSIGFYDAALQVPGILEKFDLLAADLGTKTSEVDSLLQECGRLETQLRIWFADWIFRCQIERRSDLYSELPISEFSSFAEVCSDRTFTTGYMFPNFPMAYLASLYWTTVHYLRSTTQSLHLLRHTLDKTWYPTPSCSVPVSELESYILNLCKTIPFFCEPVSSNAGHVGIFLPLRTAALYFTSHSMWNEAKWVGAVRQSVFTKGLSPPQLQVKPRGPGDLGMDRFWQERMERVEVFKGHLAKRAVKELDGVGVRTGWGRGVDGTG
jgi:hypothetical protein